MQEEDSKRAVFMGGIWRRVETSYQQVQSSSRAQANEVFSPSTETKPKSHSIISLSIGWNRCQ